MTTRLLLLRPAVLHGGRLVGYQSDVTGSQSPAGFTFPPTELLYAAAVARRVGVEVGLIDAPARREGPRRALERAVAWRPTHVLVPTPLAYLLPALDELLWGLHHTLPGARVAVCGPEVTADPGAALERWPLDAVLRGEPDGPALDWLQGRSSAAGVIRSAAPGPLPSPPAPGDLDALPHPARDLLEPSRYHAPFSRRGPYTSVWASRGCAHGSCRFCPSAAWRAPGDVARHSPAWVVEDLRRCAALGFREVFFRDQTFTADRAWAQAICDGILRAGLDLRWRCLTRVDAVEPDLLRSMRAAGCYQVSLGFESTSQGVLDACDKGIAVEQSRRAARAVREAGLELVGYFLVGLPGDTPAAIARAGHDARALGCDFAQFNAPIPTPGAAGGPGGGDPAGDAALAAAVRRAYLRFYLRPGFAWGRRHLLGRPRLAAAAARAAWALLRHGS